MKNQQHHDPPTPASSTPRLYVSSLSDSMSSPDAATSEPITSPTSTKNHHYTSSTNTSTATITGVDASTRKTSDNDEEAEEDEDEEDEEPKLKYTRLTSSLGNVYRNGDATSAALVSGDKLILGTHNGNIHILSLPTLHPLREYRAHTASITSISVSPPIPPPSSAAHNDPSTITTAATPLHIATSSLDGYTCITHTHDAKDISRTNFSRPINAIALSPTYKHDRIFLSGGKAGDLICSRAEAKVTNSTAGQSGSSWLPWSGGAKDTILHSGEGPISAISWSKVSPRFVVWGNEKGIKIMRSQITSFKGDRVDKAGEWRRISAVERPSEVPEEMAASWKVRFEWVDVTTLEKVARDAGTGASEKSVTPIPKPKIQPRSGVKERLIVGWGGVIWVIDVHGGDGYARHASPAPGRGSTSRSGTPEGRAWGWAEIINVISTDCIISGLTLYTPSEILLLAYLVGGDGSRENDEAKSKRSKSPPRRRLPQRNNALSPEVRIIDLETASEASAVSLMMSRYESLSANDYHLCSISPVPQAARPKLRQFPSTLGQPPGGTQEMGLGGALWAAGVNATTIFSSGASIMSRRDSFSPETARSTPKSSVKGFTSALTKSKAGMEGREDVPGWKIYIASPYDCVFATERGRKDKLDWLLERKHFEAAWNLIDKYPDTIEDTDLEEEEQVIADDDSTLAESTSSSRNFDSASEREKRRIGEFWIESLFNDEKWDEAAKVCSKVLGSSSRWEHWIWVFFKAKKIPEITPYIPMRTYRPPLPSLIYEFVLGEYLANDRKKFEELINLWPEGLYDENAVVKAIEEKLKTRGDPSVQKGSEDWRLLHECLATLYMRADQHTKALLEHIMLKNADSAIGLAKAYKLLDGIKGHVREWLLLRMDDQTYKKGSRKEWESATRETIDLLVDEGYEHEGRGLGIADVVTELQQDDDTEQLLFFYLRQIYKRDLEERFGNASSTRLNEFGDLIVQLFAEYDRPLLMQFLQTSQTYNYEKAVRVCESRNYIPELVHLLSTTGQTKRALKLIISKLDDVAMAISFAKTQDDPDLWNDLLDYSMDKPAFIRGLLENVGTAIDPIKLIKLIPEGLEIQGLKDGCARILREYEIQYSISEGVAKVFRGEVQTNMDKLRSGRRRGVKFDVHAEGIRTQRPVPSRIDTAATITTFSQTTHTQKAAVMADKKNGCAICSHLFGRTDQEQTLIGFACGHVFHLGCLLKHANPKDATSEEGEDEVDKLIMKRRSDGDDETSGGVGVDGRFKGSVAEKVTRAALIKDRVQGGCPLEVKAES